MQFRQRAEGSDDLRAEANVGHEVSVHDVDVQPAQAGSFHRAYALRERAMISGQE